MTGRYLVLIALAQLLGGCGYHYVEPHRPYELWGHEPTLSERIHPRPPKTDDGLPAEEPTLADYAIKFFLKKNL